MLTAAKPDLVGQRFGDFDVLAKLGSGGMGVVYQARQRSLGRLVALKFLPDALQSNPRRGERFRREARAIALLKHRHIVTIHQTGRCAAGWFQVLEYIKGPSLRALRRKGPLPLPGIVAVLVIVAKAVHYAHGRGVLHRDLKPANVLIEGGRRPVIIDFGLARFLDEPSSLTVDGTILGSPSYMAPEQAGHENQPVCPASDVYSLGAILYMLLTGRAPYDEGSFLSTALRVVAPEPPPPVRDLAPHVPAELERVCMKCLRKKPAERYPSAHALAEDLRRCLARLRRAAATSR